MSSKAPIPTSKSTIDKLMTVEIQALTRRRRMVVFCCLEAIDCLISPQSY